MSVTCLGCGRELSNLPMFWKIWDVVFSRFEFSCVQCFDARSGNQSKYWMPVIGCAHSVSCAKYAVPGGPHSPWGSNKKRAAAQRPVVWTVWDWGFLLIAAVLLLVTIWAGTETFFG